MIEGTRTFDTGLSRTRAGASTLFVPAERWANLNRPRLFASGGFNVSDPNRKGEPFFVFGMGADL